MDPNKREDVNDWCSRTEPFLGYNNDNPVKNQNNKETVETSREGRKLFQYIITLSGKFLIDEMKIKEKVFLPSSFLKLMTFTKKRTKKNRKKRNSYR